MITDAWTPIWGGGQEHILQVTKILESKYHHKVDIVAPQLITNKFNFHNFLHRLWFTFWVLKFILITDYDLYMSHAFSTAVFLPLVRLKSKKCAFVLHGAGVNLIGGGLLNNLGVFNFLMFLVRDIWPFNYRFSASEYRDFIVVGNGVNVKEYDRIKVKKNPKIFRIVWVGRRYDPIKGIKYLEEATSNLEVKLDIVENAKREEVIRRFKLANLFVLPSLSEGLPLTLLEAMAAKLPVIVTDVGSCRKIVENANCGYVVKPGNVNELSDAILKAMKHKDGLGRNGYLYVKINYTWDLVAQKYENRGYNSA